MGWEVTLLIFIVSLIAFMSLGIPVAFSLLTVNCILTMVIVGPIAGPSLVIRSMLETTASYMLLAIPFFVLLGELLYRSGLVLKLLDSVSKCMGNIPGRLGMVTVLSGALLGALSGSAMASTATLGSIMAPDMIEKGYSKRVTVGSIVGGGGMSMVIPPSSVAILIGSIGGISISKLLIGGIIPGILLAVMIMLYIGILCTVRRSEAPKYIMEAVSLKELLYDLLVNVLPVGVVMVLVLLSIFLGWASPTEASAFSVIGVLVLVVIYRKFSWTLLRDSCFGMLRTTVMIFFVMAGAAAFSQIMAYTGATRGLIAMVTALPLPNTGLMALMIVIVLMLGCFFDPNSILMIVLPLFMPLINLFEFDPVVFGLILLVCMDASNLTPPFGLALFVAKGVLSDDFTFMDIVKGSFPIALIEIVVVVFMLLYPALFYWLPNLM